MNTWKDVKAGDRVQLGGATWVVTKVKKIGGNTGKAKKAKVTVIGAGGRFDEVVRLKDRVTIKKSESKKTPLRDRTGAQTRWATEREAAEKKRPLPAGDPSKIKPPAKKYGTPWETPLDKVERKLDSILGARLIGATDDESVGYFVPPVDVSTIASHMALFHGTPVREYGIDDLRRMHDLEHEQALKGIALHVNHWHTEKRPEGV